MLLNNWNIFFIDFILKFELFAITYLFIANSSYLIILILGLINSRKRYIRSEQNNSSVNTVVDLLRPISILVPAYNEEETVCESVYSLLRLNYPNYEIIVVNDGSKDKTIERLVSEFELQNIFYNPPQILPTEQIKNTYISKNYPNLYVIDKENGGKADALNTAINYSSFPLVCCIDSDTILDENGLIQLSYPFFENPNEMLAVGGTIRVVNNTTVKHGRVQKVSVGWSYLSLIQIVEYLRAFLVGRMGWDYLNATTIISGAFGLFKKRAIIEVGGYGTNTIGEDLELLLRIHEYYLNKNQKYSVKFLPDPVCWTEVPSSFKVLGKQRSRWQQGLMEGMWSSRKMFFRPHTGVIGNIALPYLFLFELLSAPIELFGYMITVLGFALGVISLKVALTFLAVSMLYGWILSLGALIIEEITFKKYKSLKDYFKLFIGVLLEQFGYHQINLYWRLKGMWNYCLGKKSWGEMTRSGFKKAS